MRRKIDFLTFLALGGLVCLTGCRKEAPPQEPSATKPAVVGTSYPIANLAWHLAGDDLTVVYPVPPGVAPSEWKEPAKLANLEVQLANLEPKAVLLLSKEDIEILWVAKLVGKSEQARKIVPLPGNLNPDAISALLNEVAAALKEVAPEAAPGIETRRLALESERLNPLQERWGNLGKSVPRFRALAFGETTAGWVESLPVDVTVIDRSQIVAKAKETGARYIFLSGTPSASLQADLTSSRLEPIVLDPGIRRTAEGDLFSVIEHNLEALEAVSGELRRKSKGTYEGAILPTIEKYCIDCHDSDNEEGDVNFESFLTNQEAVSDPDFWDGVAAQLELGTMPPLKKGQPSPEERTELLAWISKLSDRWDHAEFGRDPGQTTIRRLNKNEYNYTVRDLFGLRIRPADGFPEDSGGGAGFDNNADALFLAPLLMENYVESAALVAQAVFADINIRRKFVLARPGPEVSEEQAARRVFAYWASIAYRRPAKKPEIDRLVQIYQRERKKKKSYDASIQMSLVGMLISPNFLYRSEVEKPEKKPYPLDSFDLANRLSYFLWSSMPDQELFQLARSGELHKPEVIEAQVTRMLAHTRSLPLSMHFAGQWFGWEELRSRANPDRERYPQFTFPLRISMYRESTEFFRHLIATNASAYDLIDCNYAFLNDQLASHYRIPGVTGKEFRKVPITDRNRGGVLGMGSVLVATSLPLRSSPAVRGDYVLTELLGTPPPSPPMNVEQLPEDDTEIKSMTFREALEQHRQDVSCKSCHEIIDPIGFGMENFDAIGRWRTSQNGKPIDATGVMPDGKQITAPADLKQILMGNKELFAHTFVEKLLSYSLGRELTPYDRPVIAEITQKVIASDGRIHTAFIEVAKSYPFRNRRNQGFKPTLNEPNP